MFGKLLQRQFTSVAGLRSHTSQGEFCLYSNDLLQSVPNIKIQFNLDTYLLDGRDTAIRCGKVSSKGLLHYKMSEGDCLGFTHVW